MDHLLTTAQLAQQLSVSVETVRWWRKRGSGPRAIKLGRHVRYRDSDVQVWLAERTERIPA